MKRVIKGEASESVGFTNGLHNLFFLFCLFAVAGVLEDIPLFYLADKLLKLNGYWGWLSRLHIITKRFFQLFLFAPVFCVFDIVGF